MTADVSVFLAIFYEHTGDEYRFCNGAFARTGNLETLARCLRETIQIQAVIPVGTTNQWEVVRTFVRNGIMETPTQVFHQRCSRLVAATVVEITHLIKNGEISSFTDVSAGSGNEPKGIIVETGADTEVTSLGKWLILMISGTVGKLRIGNVEDSFSCTRRNQMHESEQIL